MPKDATPAQPPTLEEYRAARRVVLYEYGLLRESGRWGALAIAHDQMVANIVFKSSQLCDPTWVPAVSVESRRPLT